MRRRAARCSSSCAVDRRLSRRGRAPARARGRVSAAAALWVVSSDVEKMPEDQTPAVVVASPGLTDPPRPTGDGMYIARWRVRSLCTSARAATRSRCDSRACTSLALRALIVQQQARPRSCCDASTGWMSATTRCRRSTTAPCARRSSSSPSKSPTSPRATPDRSPRFLGPGDSWGPTRRRGRPLRRRRRRSTSR
jgi:hypothetical protein